MRKIVTTAVIIIVAGGVTLGWWLLQNEQSSGVASPADTVTKVPDPNKHSYTDVDFARKIIVHNQQGIQMAAAASVNAQSEEVRQLATRIGENLLKDTNQYIAWLTEWKEVYFNLSDFPEMDGHDMYPTYNGMASISQISTLEAARGSSVDELFLRLMIAHHEGAKEFANGIEFRQLQFGQMIDLKSKRLIQVAEEVQIMKQLQANG